MFKLLLGLCLLVLTACGNSDKIIEEHAFIMGTMVSIDVAENLSETNIRTAIKASMQEMQRVEAIFSSQKKNSVYAFNHSQINQWVLLDTEVSQLLTQSLQIMQKSHAAFHPLLGQLKTLWGIETEHAKVPEREQIQKILPMIAQANLTQEDKKWMRPNSYLQLDFGAIAKGYAIDQAVQVLRQHGIHNAIVNVGGDMRIIGKRFDRAWRIGIKHPRQKENILGWMLLEGDISLVTSGDYERFFTQNGQSYHHIFDSRTGYPATASQSVTVIAKNATLADAWSTALFVLGHQTLTQISLPKHIEYFIIDQHGKQFSSKGMQKIFHVQ